MNVNAHVDSGETVLNESKKKRSGLVFWEDRPGVPDFFCFLFGY
jgi:hypothetical protein